MKHNNEIGSGHNRGTIILRLILERDVNVIQSFSKQSLLPYDRTIHEIRKSLKSISAIFLLYKHKFKRLEYFRLRYLIRSLSKRYGLVRESYVYLQTYKNSKERLNLSDCSDLEELRTHLELKYKQIAEADENGIGYNRPMVEEFILLTDAIAGLDLNAGHRHLKKRIEAKYKTSKRLFDKLKLSSSHEEFHQFRKCTKQLYLQQAALKHTGFPKIVKHPNLLFKVTEYLGKEHDLQMFYEYLNIYFVGLTPEAKPFIKYKINKIRKKILKQYPQII